MGFKSKNNLIFKMAEEKPKEEKEKTKRG